MRKKVEKEGKKEKKERKNELKNRERKTYQKKKFKSCGCCSNNGSFYVCLIMEMPSKTKLWKLKTPKMCFQFP